jgi:molybdenum cofactor guanylyltransferase
MSPGRQVALPTGIVLAGGRSARMGVEKACIPWEGSTLLAHAVETIAPLCGDLVVVRSAGGPLPPLPAHVRVVDDEHPDRGPLQGLVSGLRTLTPGTVAFVTALDMPFLDGSFVGGILAALPADADAAVPRLAGRAQPLAAVYRAGVVEAGDALLAAGRRSMGELLSEIRVHWLDDLPGAAECLRNVNTPSELEAARRSRR